MKGIYSFTLVFVFSVVLLLLIHAGSGVREKIGEGSERAMEIERASFLRFQLEENTDFIIRETIEKEIKAGNRNPYTLNQKICGTLEQYFQRMENETALNAGMEFFEVNTANLSKQFTPTAGKLKKIKKLEEYCKTVVINLKEHLFLVQFYFTGGILKNRAVLGKILVGEAEQYFLLLPGYSIEMVIMA